jgi:dCTP deaminase
MGRRLYCLKKVTEDKNMGFWSRERFLEEHSRNNLVSEFNESRLKYGRYYLRLHREALVTSDGSKPDQPFGQGPSITIPAGQIALLFTLESIHVPHHAMGFISLRTPEKIRGLVNISGFHVDPGFNGHLQFSVYNAGSRPIYLDYGSECFLLWFCDLAGPIKSPWNTEDSWDRKNEFQKATIKATDRERLSDGLHSPGALHNRIKALEESVNAIIAVGLVIIFPLLIAVGVVIFEKSIDGSVNKIEIPKLIIYTSLITSIAIALTFAGIMKFRNRRRN